MRIGIVGSRRRNTLADRRIVFDIVAKAMDRYSNIVTIVSGGCPQGADAFAKEAARYFDLEYVEHPVLRDPPIRDRLDFTLRAHVRNRKIAEDSYVIFALVHPDRDGGTENTIAHGISLSKHVFLVDQEGCIYLPQDASATHKVGDS